MPRRNIYLPDAIDALFAKEPHKSALVAELLAKRYGIQRIETVAKGEPHDPLLVCANGHLMRGNGKCSGPGCQYS